jgi:DNA-directed DNA polymerase|nr:MAG TPA: DNA polymerase [Caudoviricetes sp.]
MNVILKPVIKKVKKLVPVIKSIPCYYTGDWYNNFPFRPKLLQSSIITTLEELKELKRNMMRIPAFAFDTETNTLRVVGDNKEFRCVGISISWGENNNYYIPIGHLREEDIDKQLTLDIVVRYLRPVFARKNVKIYGWNIKFDMHVLARIGIRIRTKNIFDGMIASWLCNENTPNGLKENSAEKMGIEQTHFKDTTDTVPNDVKKQFGYSSNSKVPFSLVLIEDGAPYAIDDAFYTWCCCLGYEKQLVEDGMDKIYEKMYVPFIFVIFDMEETGVTVDVERLKNMGEEMQKDLEELQYKIYEIAGVEFNINSSQQKAEILFGYCKEAKEVAVDKLPKYLQKAYEEGDKVTLESKGYCIKNNKVFKSTGSNLLKHSFNFSPYSTTGTGVPSTDSDTIWKLSNSTFKVKRKQQGVEMCKYIGEYAKLSKLKTAFVDGILEQMYEDNKVHPSFNIIGTDSGRLSCIAEDTPVMCVGGDKPIQDMKEGDLVYCYDDLGNLRVRKVLRVIDKGVRPCISLNLRSQGSHDYTNLVCTPDHKIRLVDGSWVEAQYLTGERVSHLRRSKDVRPRLYGINSFCEQEQIVIKREVFNCTDSDMHIHHKDFDKGNNSLENLEVVSINEVGDKHVYDLEVEDFHNFIAGEVCVHNCSSPNLQQLPKAEEDDKYQIRSVFIGSINEKGERNKIIAIDYHNLEMVCLTHFSGDKNLSEMFANDDDAHGSTAVNMFGLDCTPVEVKKKYPHLRQASKVINFMLMYGGGASTLYDGLKNDHYSPLDLGAKEYLEKYKCKNGVQVAQVFIDKYFESYSGVAKFIQGQKKFAHRNGYVLTVLGRKRRLPDINSSDFKQASYCERLSVNSAIQGTAGDITINAQIRVSNEERLKELGCKMLIQIHDELVFECPEENLEEAIEIIKYLMEHPFGDNPKRQIKYLRADAGTGNTYQQAK